LLPTNQSHEAYQEFVTSQIRLHYVGGILSLVPNDWFLIEKLWFTDLSVTVAFLKDHYGTCGPKPIAPDCMLRSYLLMLDSARFFHHLLGRRITQGSVIC
jgi:hypothetical protein